MDRRAFVLITVAGVLRVIDAIPGSAPGRAGAGGRPHRVTVTKEMLGAGAVSSGVALPSSPPVTGSRTAPVPSWGKPLPYPLVIADRRNNRLIEVAPNKRIVWEFPSPDLTIYRGNDDVYFAPDGRRLAISEEDNYDVHIVDYGTRTLAWTYGASNVRGSGPGYFDYPDDAHLLDDGTLLTADIRNCRVLVIDPRTNRIVTEWGKPGHCRHDPPRTLAFPNGVAPLANGDILITEIGGAWISRVTRGGEVVWTMPAPRVRYPSDAFLTADGQVIVADYTRPGRIVIFDPATRQVTWEYGVESGEAMLDHPSLVRELPDTRDVVATDDWRNRVVVIDRGTKKIIWQYGVTDQKGYVPGYLDYPDGFAIDVFHDWKAVVG